MKIRILIKSSLSFIFMFSFSWGIGLKGLIIPENGYVLSTVGTGIAEGISPSLNPALNVRPSSYIQFSLNRWLGDIKGNHFAYHFGKEFTQSVTLQTWNAEELQLWGDTPNSNSLGTFSTHYISAAYSISHALNTPFRFGLRLQSNYCHLFTETMSGVTLSGGALIPINSFFTIGFVIKNIGYENINNIKSQLPIETGLGTKVKLPFNILFLSDAVHITELGTDIRLGFRTDWKWINLHMGVSVHEKRNSKAMGFSFNYQRWFISYGIYYHENSMLAPSLPQFIDIRYYL